MALTQAKLAILSLMVVLSFHAASAWADATAQTHVALLETAVVSKQDTADEPALAAMVDRILMADLTGRAGWVMVDRTAVDALLVERENAVAGLTKLDADQVDAALRPFWAAGVLVVSEIDVENKLLVIEAISTQRGSLLAGIYQPLEHVNEAAVRAALTEKLPAFWKNVQSALSWSQRQQVMEVATDFPSGLARTRWLGEEAAAVAAERVAAAKHLGLLVPRHPLVTKEERLLRLLGLAEVQEGDEAARLRASPDVMVRLSVQEHPEVGKTFEQTPLTLSVEITRSGDGPIKQSWTKPVGQWPGMLKTLETWLDKQLGKLGDQTKTSTRDDDDQAKALAERMLAGVGVWIESGSAISDLPVRVQMHLHDVALRASHLDPTSETAAWLVAITFMADGNPRKSNEQAIKFLDHHQRYIDRFGDQNPRHLLGVLQRMTSVGIGRMWNVQREGLPQGVQPTNTPLLEEPNPDAYAIARRYLPAMAEYGVRSLTDPVFRGSNTYQVFARHLISYLIPNIADDQIDSEFRWWRNFYRTRIESIPHHKEHQQHGGSMAVPWDLVAAAFAARARDPQAVRRHLQAVASAYPRDVGVIWGGNHRWNPSIIPIYLKAAGDPQWKTWQPDFSRSPGTRRASYEDLMQLRTIVGGKPSPIWGSQQGLELPARVLAIPDEVRQAAKRLGYTYSGSVEALLQTDNELWLLAPGLPMGNLIGGSGLWVVGFNRDAPDGQPMSAQEVPWPKSQVNAYEPRFRWAHAIQDGEQWVVFIATWQHGILRIDKVNGRWVGRWLDSSNGMPADDVQRLATIRHQGRDALLAIGTFRGPADNKSNFGMMVWAVDLRTNEPTLVYDGVNQSEKYIHPAAVLKNGRTVVLELAGSSVYPELLNVEDIERVTKSGLWFDIGYPTSYVKTKPNDDPSEYLIWKDGQGNNRLDAYDVDTLKRTQGIAPGAGSKRRMSSSIQRDRVVQIVGNLMRGRASPDAFDMDNWPNQRRAFMAGGDEVLWIGLDYSARRSRRIVGYRPAPRDTKDWAADDQWIGPFWTPGRADILGFYQTDEPGHYLFSTARDVMLLDEDEMIKAARQAGQIRSTKQWRENFTTRIAEEGWQCAVPAMLLSKEFDQALDLLQQTKSELDSDATTADERLAIDFWIARTYAETDGRADDAIDAYDAIITRPGVSAAAELYARANQLVMLHREKRWAQLLDKAETLSQRFPQTMSAPTEHQRRQRNVNWYIDEAQKHLDQSP